jgi:hypothetical protein
MVSMVVLSVVDCGVEPKNINLIFDASLESKTGWFEMGIMCYSGVTFVSPCCFSTKWTSSSSHRKVLLTKVFDFDFI